MNHVWRLACIAFLLALLTGCAPIAAYQAGENYLDHHHAGHH